MSKKMTIFEKVNNIFEIIRKSIEKVCENWYNNKKFSI